MAYLSAWKLAIKGTQEQIEAFKLWLAGFPMTYSKPATQRYYQQEVDRVLKRVLYEVDGCIVFGHENSSLTGAFDKLLDHIEVYTNGVKPEMEMAFGRVGDDSTDRDIRTNGRLEVDIVVTVDINIEGIPEPPKKEG